MSNFQIHQLSSGAITRNSNIIHDTEVNGVYGTRKDIAGAVADLASANVAALYDTTVTYAIGQYCLYEGDIYRCIAITTGAFDPTAWTQIVVSGEFRRVVELTSAQYAALTLAEQNNGTIYVKTDEETTAADISYTSGVSVADKLDNVPTFDTLTSSDNNKLLGVIVSGGDISVGAIGTISGTITPTSGWTLNSGILNKSGKVCEAYVEITGGTLSEGWNTLATIPSGFRPPNNMDFVGIDNRNVTACQAKITSSGNLQVFKTSSLANNIRLHVTYLIS